MKSFLLPVSLMLAVVLGSCAGTFEVRVQSTAPDDVAAVFVLFGPDTEFEDKERSAEIAKLILPSRLRSYAGYAEYELSAGEGAVVWNKLSQELPAKKIELSVSADETPVMRFEIDRGLLDMHPDLGIAVIVRNTRNEYTMKSWARTVVAEAEGVLVVDVSALGVDGGF